MPPALKVAFTIVKKYQPSVKSRMIFQHLMIIHGIKWWNITLDVTDGWYSGLENQECHLQCQLQRSTEYVLCYLMFMKQAMVLISIVLIITFQHPQKKMLQRASLISWFWFCHTIGKSPGNSRQRIPFLLSCLFIPSRLFFWETLVHFTLQMPVLSPAGSPGCARSFLKPI